MNSRDLIIICTTIILLLSIGIFMNIPQDNDTAFLNQSIFNINQSSIPDNPIGSILNTGEVTILNMTSDPYLNEGDSLKLILVCENGTPIANQRIEINLTDDNGICENFTFNTDSNGECQLEDLIAGNFSFIAKYYGNGDYKESSISGDITVIKNSDNDNDNGNYNDNNNEKGNYI